MMKTGRAVGDATASERARRQRRVKDWEHCRSAGIEQLLERGAYRHPRIADLFEDPGTGVLLFKPHVRVTIETLRDLDERVAECGYVIAEGCLIPPADVRARRLAARHYHLHQTIAERGALNADDRRRLLQIYDGQEFRRRYGCSPAALPVMPVYQFIAETGVPVATINQWSVACANAHGLASGSIDAANELADCKYVNLFRDDADLNGTPVFLLNPHMPAVVGEFEESARPLVVVRLLAVSSDALPWSEVRVGLCGASDPARALPGSIRRDAYDGVFPLRLESGEPIDRTRNGIHLSDGPVEALREIAIWFDRDPAHTSIGRALAGESSVDLQAAIDRPFIAIDGRRETLKEATRGKTLDQVREILVRGRLLDIDEQGDTDRLRGEGALLETPSPGNLAERHERLRSMMMGYKLSKAIYVVAKLKVVDLIASGTGDVETLSRAARADADSLRRLLRFVAAAGLLTERTPSVFQLTPLGELLISDRAGSDWAWILKEGELWWESWDRLLDTVTSGTPGFDLAHGKGLFDYLEDAASTEVAGRTLAALTSAGSDAEVRAILAAYEFGAHKTVIDVGGGNGVLLLALLKQHSEMRGVLFDLPYVVALAAPAIAAACVGDRCTTIAGSFFESIPAGGDIYVLRSVLHDWDDARSLEILRHCRRAISSGARLLIVEVLGSDDAAATEKERFSAALRDVNLMVMTSGRKRTADEHRALLKATGFDLGRVIPTAGRFVILEAVPV
jgi:hypothetical protein